MTDQSRYYFGRCIGLSPGAVDCEKDDTHPSIIWVGSWITAGNAAEYNSTTHGTGEDGALFMFPFRGTSVSVFGTNPQSQTTPRTIACTVDNTHTVREDLQYTPANLYKSTFCSISSLDPGYHILVFQAGLPNGTLYVDYLAYEETSMSSDNQSSPLSATHPTSTSIPAGVATGTPGGPSLVPFHQVVIAAIIGAAVAACALAVITATVTLLWYRRRLAVSNASSYLAHPLEEDFPSTHGASFHTSLAQPQSVNSSDPSMVASNSGGVASTAGECTIGHSAAERLEEHVEQSSSKRWRRTFQTLRIDRRTLQRKLGLYIEPAPL